MSDPIQIVITAETTDAMNRLQAFLSQTGSGLQQLGNSAAAAAGHATSALGQNRMAIMELGHAARATAESLAFGTNPLRILALESPRIAQAFGEMNAAMRASIMSVVPALGGVALAAGGVFGVIHMLNAQWERLAVSTNKTTEAFQHQAEAIRLVTQAAKGGMIDSSERSRLLEMLGLNLNGPLKLGVAGDGSTNPPIANAQPRPGITDFSPTAFGLPDPARIEQVNEELVKLGVLLVNIDPKTHQRSYTANPELQSLVELTSMREKYEAQMEVGFDKQRARATKEHDEELRNLDVEIAKAAEYRQQLEIRVRGENDPEVKGAIQNTLKNLSAEKLNDARTVLEQQYQDKLAAIDKAEQQKKAQQEEEQQRKIAEESAHNREAAAKLAREDLRAVEDQITVDQDQAGNRRGELIQAEYKKRVDAAQSALDLGEISEQEYTHLVSEAAHKRTEAEKEYTAQLERTAARKKEIEQLAAEVPLKDIAQDDLLTDPEKIKRSLPYWQQQLAGVNADIGTQKDIIATNAPDSEASINAQERLNQLLVQRLDLQQKIDSANEIDDFSYQLSAEITRLQNFGTTAQQVAQTFGEAWQGSVNSVSNGLTHLFLYGAQRGQWFVELWNGMAESIVGSITRMATQWIVSHVIMTGAEMAFYRLSTAMGWTHLATSTANKMAEVGVHVGAENTKTGATWAGTAARTAAHLAETVAHGVMVAIRTAAHVAGEIASTMATVAQSAIRVIKYIIEAAVAAMASMASIPYVGPELAVAAAAAIVAAGIGIAGGFREGGYTGDGPPDEIAGWVHRREIVIPEGAVNRIGRGNLEAMIHGGTVPTSGGAGDGSSSQSAQSHRTDAFVYFDQRQMLNHLEKSDAHEQLIVDIMNRNIHRVRARS